MDAFELARLSRDNDVDSGPPPDTGRLDTGITSTGASVDNPPSNAGVLLTSAALPVLVATRGVDVCFFSFFFTPVVGDGGCCCCVSPPATVREGEGGDGEPDAPADEGDGDPEAVDEGDIGPSPPAWVGVFFFFFLGTAEALVEAAAPSPVAAAVAPSTVVPPDPSKGTPAAAAAAVAASSPDFVADTRWPHAILTGEPTETTARVTDPTLRRASSSAVCSTLWADAAAWCTASTAECAASCTPFVSVLNVEVGDLGEEAGVEEARSAPAAAEADSWPLGSCCPGMANSGSPPSGCCAAYRCGCDVLVQGVHGSFSRRKGEVEGALGMIVNCVSGSSGAGAPDDAADAATAAFATGSAACSSIQRSMCESMDLRVSRRSHLHSHEQGKADTHTHTRARRCTHEYTCTVHYMYCRLEACTQRTCIWVRICTHACTYITRTDSVAEALAYAPSVMHAPNCNPHRYRQTPSVPIQQQLRTHHSA